VVAVAACGATAPGLGNGSVIGEVE